MIKNKCLYKIKKRENTYIINLDGAYIYKAILGDGKYSTKGMNKTKLYTATIPYSLEMIRLDEYYDKEIIFKDDRKQYTKAIVNVNFDKNYSEWEDSVDEETGEVKRVKTNTTDKKFIRKYLYVNGFALDGTKYVFYKRGASKARTGSDLFIKKTMYEELMKRSRLLHNNNGGLVIKEGEEADITSLNAYQSLILSGLEDVIEISKDSIFIIPELSSKPFKTLASATYQKENKLITETKEIERINDMTDGESLIDESLFKQARREDKGMMLLRNDFFKSCGLNTKIQEFFKEIFKDEYETKILKDMFGNEIPAKDIKIIITPSSLKYLKFAYKFKSKKECYEDWMNNVDELFGIVKSDKVGNYGTWNRLTYQIINSMPFTKEDIRSIAAPEIDYVIKLKNNLAYFMNHVNLSKESIDRLDDLIDEFEEDENIDEANCKSSKIINDILSINSDFQYTQLFKIWRRDQIDSYVKELRKGKLRIEDTLYGTIFGNPFEMLLSSVGLFDGTCLGKGTEIYCPFYKDETHLATFRNPHINAGNVMVSYNKYHKEYKWFNLTNNTIILNVSDNDFPDRGQGFDYDSDTLLLTNNIVVVKKAFECQKYPTPINLVKGDSKKRLNTMEELADLDNVLSNNFIGKIINKSQIINSYMWNAVAKGEDKELIDLLYGYSSQLSSLSQIELDKAKKSFDNISMSKELRRINNIQYNDEDVIGFEYEDDAKKMVVPRFFDYVAQDNTYRETTYFETPMDYLQEIIDELERPIKTKKINLSDLLCRYRDFKKINNKSQEDLIYNIILKCSKKINSTMLPNSSLNEKGKATVSRKAKDDALIELSKLTVRPATIFVILNKCFSDDKKEATWSKIGMLTLNLLYNSNKVETLSVFRNENNRIDMLVEDENEDINIFGNKYKIIESAKIVK